MVPDYQIPVTPLVEFHQSIEIGKQNSKIKANKRNFKCVGVEVLGALWTVESACPKCFWYSDRNWQD